MGLHFPGSMGSPSFEIGVISPMPKASGSVDVLNDSYIIWANSTDTTLKASLISKELRPVIPDDLQYIIYQSPLYISQ